MLQVEVRAACHMVMMVMMVMMTVRLMLMPRPMSWPSIHMPAATSVVE
jgi:hypothetical protein